MFKTQIRKQGEDLVIAIPESEVMRLNLGTGQWVSVDVMPVGGVQRLSPELKKIFDEQREAMRPAMEYLRDH